MEMNARDIVMLGSESLKRVKLKTEKDKKLVAALEWSLALHPEESRLTVESSEDTIDIAWPEPNDIPEDVCMAINQIATDINTPTIGTALHLIGVRRIINSQHVDVLQGDSFKSGLDLHINNLVSPA